MYKISELAHTFDEWERQDLNTGLSDTRTDGDNRTIFVTRLNNNSYIELCINWGASKNAILFIITSEF